MMFEYMVETYKLDSAIGARQNTELQHDVHTCVHSSYNDGGNEGARERERKGER